MKNCPNCRAQADDTATSCPVCGTALDAIGHVDPDFGHRHNPGLIPTPEPQVHIPSISDRTNDYLDEDIAENKLLCMAVYLLDAVGIIIALLMAPTSEFTRFHILQSLKFTVLEALILLASALLCWTFIVPILGIIAWVVVLIAKLICFGDVCRGKAKESMFLNGFKFLN